MPKNRKRPRIWHRGWKSGRIQDRYLRRLPVTPEAAQVTEWGNGVPVMREHPERPARSYPSQSEAHTESVEGGN